MKKNYSSNRLYQNGKIDSFMTPYRDDNKKFIGWYTEPNGGKKSEIGEILTENISLYAHWADEAYTIYIHDDFYGGYNIYYFEPDSKFGILSTPTKEGYKFIGWYDEIDNGNLITSETIVNDYNEMHIYPHWIKTEQYTIFFDSNGGDDVQTTITIQNGYEYGDLPMPTKIGYGFLGWFTKKNGGTRIKPSDVFDISQDQVLYAHWLSPDLYRISFDSNGGSIVNSLIEKYPGEPYGELPVPTKDNYTFVGWYDDSIEGSKINSDTVFDGTANKVLYAHWREGILNECVVSFDTNGGSGIIDSVHLYTGDKITLPVVTKKGYTFINWTYNGDVVTENTNFDEISEATLIANWQVNNYIVHFDANGGNGTMEDIIMTYDKAKMLPENLFVRNGYSFVGWSKTYDGDVTYDSYSLVSNIGSQGTVTLYAVWQENPKETKLYFDFNGGEVLDEHFYQPLYLYDDETIYYFPEIKRDGYTFVNWMYNDTVVDNSTTFYDMGEVTIKANWQPNNYTITFDGNGGIGSMENITMTYDVTKTLPENSFVYDDKVFVGWGRTADGNVEYQNMEITKNIAFEGEVTLYAHWADVEENVCIVNFDGNGGVGDTRRIYLYGNEKIYQLPEVAKKGYTLISCTYNDNPVDTDTSFEGNSEVTLIANWQPNKYIVKFNKDYDEEHGTMSDIEMT